LASGVQVPGEVLNEIAQSIHKKIKLTESEPGAQIDGSEKLASIMNLLGSEASKNIMSGLAARDQHLRESIEDKLVTFDDIPKVDNPGLRKALTKISNETLALALKQTTKEILLKIFNNLSTNRQKILKKELRTQGARRKSAIDEARKEIVSVIRRLQETGELFIDGKGSSDEYV